MAAHQAPPFLAFSRQEHWSGWPCSTKIMFSSTEGKERENGGENKSENKTEREGKRLLAERQTFLVVKLAEVLAH